MLARSYSEAELAHFAAIIESSDDAIISKTPDGIITSWNPAAERMFGYSEEEALGKPLLIIFPKDRVGEEKEFLARIVRGERIEHVETVRKRKDGSLIDVSVTTSPIKDHQGNIIGASKIARDISRQKKSEQEARQRAEELARSNVELEQFAYVASHDLQEPLRAVASCVQLLKKRYAGQIDARADEFIRHAVDGAKRMQQLIDDLLAFSRVSTRSGKFEMVDSGKVFEEVLARLATSISESDAVVTCQELPRVRAEKVQLGQVFQNLLGNALKFRSGPRPEIQVSAEQRADDWHFSIRDNGIGIDPQYFERIFKLYQRLHSRTQYPGTGIGLAICLKIVQRHGGRLWVESQPGCGSTFHFTLPKQEESHE